MAVRIVLYATDDTTAKATARAAFARIAELDATMSDYRPSSEVRRLGNRHGEWTVVSPELFDVLTRALAIAHASDGAFDPTVGPVVQLWREARRTAVLPAPAALDSARARVGWRLVEIDSSARAVRFARSGMQLDLGGIAKGYILQAAAETMRGRGVTATLVQAGGDVVAGDSPPGSAGWVVDVPGANAPFAARAAAFANGALSSSGPVSQFVEIAGVRYSHVVDPFTGLGITRPHVTHVIAGDGASADAIATALGVMGSAGVARLAARLDVRFDAMVVAQ